MARLDRKEKPTRVKTTRSRGRKGTPNKTLRNLLLGVITLQVASIPKVAEYIDKLILYISKLI